MSSQMLESIIERVVEEALQDTRLIEKFISGIREKEWLRTME